MVVRDNTKCWGCKLTIEGDDEQVKAGKGIHKVAVFLANGQRNSLQ